MTDTDTTQVEIRITTRTPAAPNQAAMRTEETIAFDFHTGLRGAYEALERVRAEAAQLFLRACRTVDNHNPCSRCGPGTNTVTGDDIPDGAHFCSDCGNLCPDEGEEP